VCTFMAFGGCGVDGGVSCGFGVWEVLDDTAPASSFRSWRETSTIVALPSHADRICVIDYFTHFEVF
jgi:hypothetical protein